QRLASFVDAVNEWLAMSLAAAPGNASRMARIADAWDKINQAARDADEYNLERKPLVFSVFGWLPEGARPQYPLPATPCGPIVRGPCACRGGAPLIRMPGLVMAGLARPSTSLISCKFSERGWQNGSPHDGSALGP